MVLMRSCQIRLFAGFLITLAALAGITAAQTPHPKPDPLQQLLTADRPEDPKKIRLHVSLLRVPMREAAQAMLDDTGAHPDFWPNQLLNWRAAGLLETVMDFRREAEDMEEYGNSQPQKFRFIGPGAASRFWYQHQYSKESQAEPPDPNELLQELSEADVGNFFRARVNLKHGWQQADVQFNLLHCPKPEARPTTTWPLPAFTAPRFLFRPWELRGVAIGPASTPFLLGAQMEPPHDGQVHTDHLWMAFGRITLPAKNGRELNDEQTEFHLQHRVQTWTLAVDQNVFLPWLRARRSDEHDGQTLIEWLQRAAAQNGVECLATSAAATSSHTTMTSSLHWQDASGFEPAGTQTAFRAAVCEADDYWLPHGLEVGLENAPATEAALSADPFANSPVRRQPGAAWVVNLGVHRPAAAIVWKKWKSAMERDETDPNAVEIGEAATEMHCEGVEGVMTVVPNRVVMAGACLKEERGHVTFLRLVQEDRAKSAAGKADATPQVPAALEPATTTVWAIDTPMAWQNRLLGDAEVNLQTLAVDLLKAAEKGQATVAGVSSQTQSDAYRGMITAANPKVFFGGPYVNTAPAPKGIFFNTRHVGIEPVGDRIELQSDKIENSPDRMLDFNVRSVRPPEWRHWGLWQPGVKETNAGNSGIEQPVFPTTQIEGRMRLQPQVPQVMAVLLLSPLGSLAAQGDDRLRWYVVRRDSPILEAKAAPKGADTRFAGYIDCPVTIQAVVVKAPRASVGTADTDAATLLRQAREGKRPVLDLVTFPKTGDAKATVAGGWDWYFTNGREHPRSENRNYEESQQAAFKAPAVMPAGTRFTDQVYLQNRIVGVELRIQGTEFSLTRDAKAPEIVTDSFSDVRLEWPSPRPEQNWQDIPKVTVNVQRPIFAIQEAKGDLPEKGQAKVTRMSDDTVLIIRTLR